MQKRRIWYCRVAGAIWENGVHELIFEIIACSHNDLGILDHCCSILGHFSSLWSGLECTICWKTDQGISCPLPFSIMISSRISLIFSFSIYSETIISRQTCHIANLPSFRPTVTLKRRIAEIQPNQLGKTDFLTKASGTSAFPTHSG